jgi:hypothetical protein
LVDYRKPELQTLSPVTTVARAIKRRGDYPTNRSVADADAAHVIADLLVRLQGQEPSPLDPAFAERDDKLADVAALTSALGVAARTRLAAPSEVASPTFVHSLHAGA